MHHVQYLNTNTNSRISHINVQQMFSSSDALKTKITTTIGCLTPGPQLSVFTSCLKCSTMTSDKLKTKERLGHGSGHAYKINIDL